MKELHNHIFSNTTCISKETMLKYINKQLTKEELHQVETHMLDCELCTDAYEGLALTQNSSILFAIDNEIDRRVEGRTTKMPLMRNLMVAASILVIAFGTYFTFSFFNNAINKSNNMALNEAGGAKESKQLESAKAFLTEEEVEEEEELMNVTNALKSEEVVMAPNVERVEEAPPEIAEVFMMEDDAEEAEVYDAEVSIEEELAMDEIVVEELAVETRQDNVVEQLEMKELKFMTNEKDAVEPALKKLSGVTAKSERKKSYKKREKNKAARMVASAPVYPESIAKEETVGRSNKNTAQRILILNDYKVVNYLDEYQKAYDAENEMKPELSSVSAGFESKADKKMVEEEQEALTVEVTYKETLENAMRLYKNKKYSNAIGQFEIILAKHPEEVNGLFYQGMSYYHLKQYQTAIDKLDEVMSNKEKQFNPEAKWYKALSLIELKRSKEAKPILQEIVQQGGFYADSAQEKLKTL